ncbi:DNA-binding protein [Klebsiella michiganensis]|uniref:hypothetical protein n=1 Tax=Klebsiella michiganensis TaxID=1134687 RepID=UPI003B232E32
MPRRDAEQLISRKWVRQDKTTTFRLVTNGNIVARLLSSKLDRDDWEIIQGLIGFVYHQGFEAGSDARADEIRQALGIEK